MTEELKPEGFVEENCFNCNGLYDDSDGPEYPNNYYPRCSIKPSMENLKGFPFSGPQKCFQIAWWHQVDWEAEAKRDFEQNTRKEGE